MQPMLFAFSIKEVLAMHMHKVHKGAAPVQESYNMCLFTSHLSHVLKNRINRKHLGIFKYLNVISVIFLQKSKSVLKYHEQYKHKKPSYYMNYATTGCPMLNIRKVICKLCVKQITHEIYVYSDPLV